VVGDFDFVLDDDDEDLDVVKWYKWTNFVIQILLDNTL